MKINKNIFIIITVIITFAGLVFLTYKVLDKENKNNQLNRFIVQPIEIQQENLMKDSLEDVIVDEDITLENEDNTIGTIEVPKIELIAPVKEGTNLDILAEFVGHFSNSSVWDGNVALAAHNRGISVKHYFDRINELVNGDIIIYKTKLGERCYNVISSKEITNTDWSVTESNSKDKNTITLITCISNQPEKRLCVVAEEKNN